MLDSGYTLDGAATALGWSRQLVGARAKILELPQAAQDLIGAARIPVSAIDTLLAIKQVSPAILGVLVAAIADGHVRGEQLARDPGWALGNALRTSNHTVFAAYLQRLSAHEADELRLGKKTDELREQARTLQKGLPDSSEPEPAYRFSEHDVDQARAAGVLIELDRSAPIITDRGVYRELARDAIKRAVAELHDRKAQHAANNKRATKSTARTPADELDSQHRAARREFARRAHAVNLDLGSALLNGLSVVDPCDPDVAKVFCYSLLGADFDQSSYTKTGERVLTLAANGLRLVLAEQRCAAR